MGADIAGVAAAQAEEMAIGIERQLGLHRQVAALVVAQEGFAALAGPFHRPRQPLRRPAHQREFRIEGVAGAEIAADVARDHAHRVVGDTEDARELGFLPHHIAAAGVAACSGALRAS